MREKITLLFNLLLLLFSLHPLTPQFQCCLFFQTGVAKRSVYFETSVPQQRAVNIEIGGRGARRRAKTHINTRSVIFSCTGMDFGMRRPIETNSLQLSNTKIFFTHAPQETYMLLASFVLVGRSDSNAATGTLGDLR